MGDNQRGLSAGASEKMGVNLGKGDFNTGVGNEAGPLST